MFVNNSTPACEVCHIEAEAAAKKPEAYPQSTTWRCNHAPRRVFGWLCTPPRVTLEGLLLWHQRYQAGDSCGLVSLYPGARYPVRCRSGREQVATWRRVNRSESFDGMSRFGYSSGDGKRRVSRELVAERLLRHAS